jgi:hypothetical protein
MRIKLISQLFRDMESGHKLKQLFRHQIQLQTFEPIFRDRLLSIGHLVAD